MAEKLYCWRCKTDVPMLDEGEYREISELFRAEFNVRKFREGTIGQAALDRYFEMTGFRETNINAVLHHRLAILGPPCSSCGKPLRTPQAKMCAACGTPAALRTSGN